MSKSDIFEKTKQTSSKIDPKMLKIFLFLQTQFTANLNNESIRYEIINRHYYLQSR